MKKIIMLILIVSISYLGCQKAPLKKIIVKVNGEPVYQEELEFYLSQMSPQMRAFYSTPQGYQKLIDRIIQNRLLAQEARRRGIDKKPEVQLVLRSLKEQILVNALVEEERTKTSDISDTELQKYFDEHRAEFDNKPRAKVSAIKTQDEALAKKIKKDVMRGMDFEEIKEKYSGQPGFWAEELSYIKQGDLMPIMDRAIFSTKVGGTTEIVKANNNYFIFKVTDMKRGDQLTFEDFKDEIITKIQAQGLDKGMQQLIDKLKAQARIKYYFKE